MWWRRSAPEVATARVTGPVIGALYLMGGLAVVAIVVLPSGGAGSSVVLTVIGPLAMVTGACVVCWGQWLPRPAFHALVLLGTALVSCVVSAAPDGTAAMALASIYSFVAVAAFFLFPPPLALAHLVTAIGACTVVLSVRGVPAGPVVALAVVTATVALVVATLVQRASSASLDGLTGLANRRGFDDALDEAMRVSTRTGAQFSVALVDVDHFKAVNDEHGHAAGDELLRSVAADWGSRLPRGALLARHGGDEFALLLPAHQGPAALQVVEELRRASSHTALSVGVAQHEPGELASQVMRRADAALYRAKADGRGRCALDGSEPDGGPPSRGEAQRTG
jgi:diguanylate cyclase (GGDEF)-like protein